MPPKTAIVLLAMGGPDRVEAIEPFLRNLFSDPLIFPVPGGRFLAPLIARRRTKKVATYYERIGYSPLNATTERQARALATALGNGALARAAFRYWGPDEASAVNWAVESGVRRLVALPMYPQYCRATTLSSLVELRRAAEVAPLELVEIDGYHDHPGYIEALAAGVLEGFQAFSDTARPHVVMSAHGVPESFARKKKDPYVAQVERTARLLADRLPQGTPWTLAYQSRVGPVRWERPYTDEVLRRLGREGTREVLMVPLTFVADHVETLDEMDIRLKGVAHEAGVVDFHRVPALNDSPAFIAALAAIVQARLAESAPAGGGK